MTISKHTISTRLGEITGVNNGATTSFLGVRYGEPPVGKKRFLPAESAAAWDGVLDATHYANRAMAAQTEGSMGQKVAGALSEDCLFLNIVTPATATAPDTVPGKTGKPKPVLVWIHGGSFTKGSANEYDGTVLAQQGDVVVVTINYRLGVFGFLNLENQGEAYVGSASNGIRDQILALHWVAANISDYGGNPNNVTLFGESAGATSILGLLAAPSANGLYHKAIAHSACDINVRPPAMTSTLAKKLGVEQEQLLTTLISMPAEELVALPISVGAYIDGAVITCSPAEAILEKGAKGVPLITGTNRDEATLFTGIGEDQPAAYYAEANKHIARTIFGEADTTDYISAMTATYPDDSPRQVHERIFVDTFRRPCVNAAQCATSAGPGGWLYRFDYPAAASHGKEWGATHASEMAFTFNTFANPDSHGFAFHYEENAEARELALQWSNTILTMAKTGNPNGAGLPQWPQYDAEHRQCLILDKEVRIESNPDAPHITMWGDEVV